MQSLQGTYIYIFKKYRLKLSFGDSGALFPPVGGCGVKFEILFDITGACAEISVCYRVSGRRVNDAGGEY